MTAKLRGLLLFFLICSQIAAQNIQTELIKGLPPNLDPGSNNTVVFRIINNSKETVTLDANVKSPTDWRLFFNKTITIAPNSINIFPVAVIIPQNAIPGFYQLFLELGNTNLNYYSTINVDTHILKRIDIDVKLVNVPKIAMAGKDILADFSIINKSNTKRRILLESSTGTVNGAKSLSLEIGETKVINVFYPTDPDLKRTINQFVDLTVSSGPYQNSDKAYVTLIPSKNYKSDKYHRLPTEVSMIYLYRNFGDYKHTGFQGDIFSSGFLTPENNNYLELRARGPDQFDNSILGLYDEYYLKYLSKNINLFIGDDSYSLTPLTEYGRFGTGVRAEFHDDNNQFGFFFMKPRFFPDYDQELAGFARYNFDENNSLGFSFLQKSINGVDKPVNLYSALYTINPLEDLSMDVEYSIGKEDEEMGHGYSIELINQTEKTYSSLNIVDAGKHFPGYYNNTLYLNGNFQYILSEKLKFFANFHEDESNAERDTLYGVSPYSKYFVGGSTFKYRKSDYLNVHFGSRERKDRMPLKKFHYREHFSRISFINNFSNLQTNVNGEFAGTTNLISDVKGTSFKSSLLLRYNPSTKLNIGSFFQYYNTYRYTEDRSQELIFGGDVSYNFDNYTSLKISYQNTHNVEEYYRDRSLFDLRLSKYFKQKHQFEFSWSEALKQKQIDDRDSYIGLKYTFHFGIPIKKTKHLGHLRGRLLNEGVNDVANVVLNFGGRIQVTNEDGLFVFNDVPPGEHYLYLDNASLDFGDIPTQKMPLVITIEPDHLTDIQIGLTKSGTILGKVQLQFEDSHSEKLTQGNLEAKDKNVIIELNLGDEFHRTVVNLDDSFTFMGLRPGDWILKVYHNSLGNNYTIKNSQMIVNLKEGESTSVNINVTKKARRIRFQPTEIIIN